METEGTATAITGYRKSDRYRRDAANKWRLVQKLLQDRVIRVKIIRSRSAQASEQHWVSHASTISSPAIEQSALPAIHHCPQGATPRGRRMRHRHLCSGRW